jgi:hypothetical protein
MGGYCSVLAVECLACPHTLSSRHFTGIRILNYHTKTYGLDSLELSTGGNTTSYIVEHEGETLESIAAAYADAGVTPEQLLELNSHLGLEEVDPENPYGVVLDVTTEVLVPVAQEVPEDEE